MVARTDKINLDGFTRDDSTGFLVLNAKPTRAGVFKYRNPDGSIRRELRKPEEVFKADSMASLKNKPFTDLHPMSGKITTSNSKGLMVGLVTGDINKTDDNYIETKITVTDADTIAKIESGKQIELSCGYNTDVVEESGEYNGEHYDCIQTNIRYNHVALVKGGRAGSKARIYCDSADDAATIEFDIKLDEEEPMTTKTLIALSVAAATVGSFKADAISFEIDKDMHPTIQPLIERNDALVAHATELQTKLDAMQGTMDELKTKADAKMEPEVLNTLVAERADILGVAAHAGLKDFDSKSNAEIKKAVISVKNDGVNLDDKSDDYIGARFDAITEQIKADTKGFESLALLQAVTQPEKVIHKDGGDSDDKSPREQYMEDTADMYQDTLKAS